MWVRQHKKCIELKIGDKILGFLSYFIIIIIEV